MNYQHLTDLQLQLRMLRSFSFLKDWQNPIQLFSCTIALGFALSLASSVQGQNTIFINYLVIDPVPISVETISNDAVIPNNPDQLIVTELRVLPSAKPVSLLDWVNTNFIPADPEPAPNTANDSSVYQEQVTQLELNFGPYAEALPELLLSLAQVLHENGELDAALEHLERASHIARINYGLFSEQQIPVIEQIINNYLKRGDISNAHQQQQYLFYLQQKILGQDITAMLPALESYAQWNMFAFTAQASNTVNRNAFSNHLNTLPPPPNTIDELNFKIGRLVNAQHIYSAILQIVRDNFGADDPRIGDIEMRMALTNYFYASIMTEEISQLHASGMAHNPGVLNTNVTPPSINSMGYLQGRDALERRLDYIRTTVPDDLSALSRASLDLADWLLLFNRHRVKALSMYQELLSDLSETIPEEELQSIFSPDYPQILPTFIHPVYTRAALGIPDDQALIYRGYIDLQFDLNRFGKTRNVQLLGLSDNTPEAVTRLLTRSIRYSRFRPRLINDEFQKEDQVQARYYYAF